MVLQSDRENGDGGFAVVSTCDAVDARDLARLRLPSPAVAVRFVDGHRAAVLDASGAFRLVDLRSGAQVDCVAFSQFFAFDDPLSPKQTPPQVSASAQNALRVDASKVYCLGAQELVTVALQSPKQRVDALLSQAQDGRRGGRYSAT